MMKLFSISAIALAAALPMAAAAQTATTTEAPAAAPVAATTDAAPAVTAPSTTVVVPVYVERLENVADDAKVTATLTEAGYKDIKLNRDGGKLAIDATKDGTAVNMVYDTTTGALTMVDGAGYTIGSTAPAIQSGDKSSQGKTDTGASAPAEGSTGGSTGETGGDAGDSAGDTGAGDTGAGDTGTSTNG